MKSTKIIQLGIAATTLALIFPPVHYKKIVNGKFVDYISDGHNMIFSIPAKYYIDWTTLVLELAIILCITLFFYYRSRTKSANTNAKIEASDIFMIPAKPDIPTDWIINGIHTDENFLKADISNCIGKITRSTPPTERPYKCGTGTLVKYYGEYGFIAAVNNQIVVIHSTKPGASTPRGITIGRSTIHDVINKYGLVMSRIRHNGRNHLFVYSQDSADLGFFVDDRGIVVAIEANIPLC